MNTCEGCCNYNNIRNTITNLSMGVVESAGSKETNVTRSSSRLNPHVGLTFYFEFICSIFCRVQRSPEVKLLKHGKRCYLKEDNLRDKRQCNKAFLFGCLVKAKSVTQRLRICSLGDVISLKTVWPFPYSIYQNRLNSWCFINVVKVQ